MDILKEETKKEWKKCNVKFVNTPDSKNKNQYSS